MAEKQQSILAPDNYRELSKPFESVDAANKAIEGFWEELYELRNKYKLPDVHVIIRINVMQGEKEGDTILSMHAGSTQQIELMTAWALGYAQSQRQVAVADVLSKAIKAGKKSL